MCEEVLCNKCKLLIFQNIYTYIKLYEIFYMFYKCICYMLYFIFILILYP